MLPVLTRYLTKADYGIVSMFSVLIGFLGPFIGLKTYAAVFRKYYDREKLDFPIYVTNVLIIFVLSTIFTWLFLELLSQPISDLTEFPESWLISVLIVCACQFLIKLRLDIWRAEVEPVKYGVFQIIESLINASLSVLLIVWINYSWDGRIIGQIVSVSLVGVVGVFLLWKDGYLKFEYNFKYIKNAFAYSLPLVPHAISGYILTMSDRIFITSMIGIEDTGLYTVGYQIGMIIGVLAESIHKAWGPWLYENLKINDSLTNKKIVKASYIYIIGILIITSAFVITAPVILNVFIGSEFKGAFIFVSWVAFGYAFKGMYLMVTNYILFAEKTAQLATITIIAALINLVLNYFFIKEFGAIGAAQATTVTFFVQFILTWYLASKVHKMPWFEVLKRK